ncbi:MAG: hypothetical protein HS119_08095 [Flavobacteriales bacterium]|nr:hypothetical protein [Flavobacteriales bacterium]MCL4856321.1 hypothetical protein [Flavobacteriales bacterium]
MKLYCLNIILFVTLICQKADAQKQLDSVLVSRVVFQGGDIISSQILLKKDFLLISEYFGFNTIDSVTKFIKSSQAYRTPIYFKSILYVIIVNQEYETIISNTPLLDIDKYFEWADMASFRNSLDKTFGLEWWFEETKDSNTIIVAPKKMNYR